MGSGASVASFLPCQGRSFCYTYVTVSIPLISNVVAVSGADALCQMDANRPAQAASVKAFIVNPGVRVASISPGAGDGQVDWVLYANRQYRRADGTVIGTTGANRLLMFNLTNSFTGAIGEWHMAGIENDWTSSAMNCGGWMGGGGSALMGDLAAVTVNALGGFGSISCATGPLKLFCVEQ